MITRTLTHVFICLPLICLPAVCQQQSTAGQASIEGRTMSADGQPLRKTNLTLRPTVAIPPGGRGAVGAIGSFQPPTPYATTSDANGNFSFTGLEAGRYTLQAERTGYINTTYGTKRTMTGVQTSYPLISLTAGQHMTGVNAELSPQATISGKVTDEDGDPMPRVQVSAVRRMYTAGSARLLPTASAATDDNGDFHLNSLQSGRYYISFTAGRMGPLQQGVRRTGVDALLPEMAYSTLYFPGAPDIETAAQVDAVEGQDKAGTNVRMRKVPVFHVRGTIGGDLPLPDASTPPAMAGRLVQVRVNMQPTNSDGTFDVGGLAPGVYQVTLTRAQGQLQTLSQTTVTIGNGDVSGVQLLAKSPVDITGRVRIPGGGDHHETHSANDGRDSHRRETGRGIIAVTDRAGVSGDAESDGIGHRREHHVHIESATLNGQDVLNNAVEMSAGGTLDVLISMTAGQAAADATIAIVPDPAQPARRDLYRQSRSGADGAFTAPPLAPGKYRIYAFEEMEPNALMDPDYMKLFESLGTSVTIAENDKNQSICSGSAPSRRPAAEPKLRPTTLFR